MKWGVIGAAVAALCCFTPVLVLALTALGLSAAIGWIDFVALPALAIFILMILAALWRRKTR